MARELLDSYAMLNASPVETNHWIDGVPFFSHLFQPWVNRSVKNPCKYSNYLSTENSDVRFFETFGEFSRL